LNPPAVPAIPDDLMWPLFFGGLGFAMACILITTAYLAYRVRRAAARGVLSKALSETIAMFLFVPAVTSIFSLVTAVGLAHDRGMKDSYAALVISALATIGSAAYFSKEIIRSDLNKG
jgi:hypothetical protein